MPDTLDYAIRQLEEHEGIYAPMKCMLCWNYPATEGAVCADCLFENKIKVTETPQEKDSV